MKLTANKYISPGMVKILLKDGWTMSKLATADPKKLATYKGIGLVSANRIVNEAKRLVNDEELATSAKLDPQAAPAPGTEPAVSVRIQRIRDREAAKRND